jgi:hypothetical protein
MFFAHIGGYKTTHLAENVVKKVYEHFKLKPNLPGYPELKERLKIARVSALKIKLLLERFEFANLCFVSKNYEVAAKMYDAIINSGFKSSEMYNNLGLCYMMQVIQSDSIYQVYEWPIFLNSKSKLSSGSQRDILGLDVKETLLKAIGYFNDAIGDKEAKYAYINLAIAHLLMDISKEDTDNNNLEECSHFLSRLSSTNMPNLNTMHGILAHYKGDSVSSKKILFDNSEVSPIAKRNYDKLFGIKNDKLIENNSLSIVFNTEINLAEIFMISKNIVRDTSNIGSKPILPSFINLSVESLTSDTWNFTRVIDKSTGKKVYFGQLKNFTEQPTEKCFIDNADLVIQTNLFTYYTFKDFIIQINPDNTQTLYKYR